MERKQSKSRDLETSTTPCGAVSMCNLKTRKRSKDLNTENKKTKKGSNTSQTSVLSVNSNSEQIIEENMSGNTSIKKTDMVTALKLAPER